MDSSEKSLIFSIPKPKNLEQEKALSNFKLKLAEYSKSIRTTEEDTIITFEVIPSPDIEKESLSEFILSYPYVGH